MSELPMGSYDRGNCLDTTVYDVAKSNSNYHLRVIFERTRAWPHIRPPLRLRIRTMYFYGVVPMLVVFPRGMSSTTTFQPESYRLRNTRSSPSRPVSMSL